jgi:hypothetical protein
LKKKRYTLKKKRVYFSDRDSGLWGAYLLSNYEPSIYQRTSKLKLVETTHSGEE